MTDFLTNYDFSNLDDIDIEGISTNVANIIANPDETSNGPIIKKPGKYILELIDIDNQKSSNDPNWCQFQARFIDIDTGNLFIDTWIPVPVSRFLTYTKPGGTPNFSALIKLCKFLHGLGYQDLFASKIKSEMTPEDKLGLIKNLKTALFEVFSNKSAIGFKVETELIPTSYFGVEMEDGTFELHYQNKGKFPKTKGLVFTSEDEIKVWMTKHDLVKNYINSKGEAVEAADYGNLRAKYYHPYLPETPNTLKKLKKEISPKPTPTKTIPLEEDLVPLTSVDDDEYQFED